MTYSIQYPATAIGRPFSADGSNSVGKVFQKSLLGLFAFVD